MRYRLKSLTIEAKQWTGKNTEEVENFLKLHGLSISMERQPDTDLFVMIDNHAMRVQRSEYIAFESTGAIEIIPEGSFDKLWEPV